MNRGFSTDTVKVSFHGYAHSHLDALCHILYKDQTYNGYARAEVNTEKGCTKLSIDRLKSGIVTRGILVDIPRLKNLPYLEPGTPVFAEDSSLGKGRHQNLRATRSSCARDATRRAPARGLSATTRRSSIGRSWLKARGIAMLGATPRKMWCPHWSKSQNLPIHTLMITAMGVLFDNLIWRLPRPPD